MRAIAPRLEGAQEVTLGEDQLEYSPVTVAIVLNANTGRYNVCVRYTFEANEREAIARGEDLYLMFESERHMPTHLIQVGPPTPVEDEDGNE